MEGDPISTSIDLSKKLLTTIGLKTTDYILLPETSGCSSVSHYDCLAEHLWTSQYANCTKACCQEIGRSCIPLGKIQLKYCIQRQIDNFSYLAIFQYSKVYLKIVRSLIER